MKLALLKFIALKFKISKLNEDGARTKEKNGKKCIYCIVKCKTELIYLKLGSTVRTNESVMIISV